MMYAYYYGKRTNHGNIWLGSVFRNMRLPDTCTINDPRFINYANPMDTVYESIFNTFRPINNELYSVILSDMRNIVHYALYLDNVLKIVLKRELTKSSISLVFNSDNIKIFENDVNIKSVEYSHFADTLNEYLDDKTIKLLKKN